MRRSAVLMLGIALVAAGQVRAQQIDSGGLRLSLASGFVLGGGELWNLDRLPIFLPASGLSRPNSSWDTLTVRRSINSGPTISIGVGGTVSGPLSFGGSFILNMLKTDNGCRVTFDSFPRPSNPNPVICATVDDDDSPFAIVDIIPYLELHLPAMGNARPYLRGGAGISNVSNTTTQAVRAGETVSEEGTGSLRPAFQGFVGIEALEDDSAIRVEFGFLRHRYDTITGVNPDATLNLGQQWRNHFSVRVGLIFNLDA